MAFRSWTFEMAAPPAPPESAEALMARDGHVDPLLAVVLPAAVTGEGASVVGPDGEYWRVATTWDSDRWHVVAVNVSDGVVAQEALLAAGRAHQTTDVRALLGAVDSELRLAGPHWAIDGRGDVQLDAMERTAVEEALQGTRVVSEEGWAVVPVVAGGRVFAALLRVISTNLDVQRLDALAIVLGEALFRRLVRAT